MKRVSWIETTLRRHFLLVALVSVNLIVGLLVLPGFGESADELSQDSYADRTIQTAVNVATQGFVPSSFVPEEPAQGSHGPAFIVFVTLLRKLFLPDADGLAQLYVDHFLYFIAFQVGVVSIYFLMLRWVSPLAAFGTALLFDTQPLFLGHAFMNPKDVVFMSLFIASVVLGLWMADHEAATVQPTGRPAWDGLRSFAREFLRGDVWLAAIVLGFSSATRIAGPLVGVIVLGCILLSRKWRLLPRLVAYGLIAFCLMILFWPYLWPDPLNRLGQSLAFNASFSAVHLTLFRGSLFNAPDLPGSYLPVLLAVQLTETALLLIAAGALALLRKIRWDLVVLTLIWFVVPTLVVIVAQVHLYNNLRQMFFIYPPLFLLAGLGLDWLLAALKHPALRYTALALVVLPGLFANFALYPYQYVYYNQLAGGVRGAYRVYELDYWNLAFREAQDYINRNAGKNANVYVDKSKYIAQEFARPDLAFNAFGGQDLASYDFIITSTAQNADERFSRFATVYVVQRDGVPLALVKKIRMPHNK